MLYCLLHGSCVSVRLERRFWMSKVRHLCIQSVCASLRLDHPFVLPSRTRSLTRLACSSSASDSPALISLSLFSTSALFLSVCPLLPPVCPPVAPLSCHFNFSLCLLPSTTRRRRRPPYCLLPLSLRLLLSVYPHHHHHRSVTHLLFIILLNIVASSLDVSTSSVPLRAPCTSSYPRCLIVLCLSSVLRARPIALGTTTSSIIRRYLRRTIVPT